jgi:hypothetical protein
VNIRPIRLWHQVSALVVLKLDASFEMVVKGDCCLLSRWCAGSPSSVAWRGSPSCIQTVAWRIYLTHPSAENMLYFYPNFPAAPFTGRHHSLPELGGNDGNANVVRYQMEAAFYWVFSSDHTIVVCKSNKRTICSIDSLFCVVSCQFKRSQIHIMTFLYSHITELEIMTLLMVIVSSWVQEVTWVCVLENTLYLTISDPTTSLGAFKSCGYLIEPVHARYLKVTVMILYHINITNRCPPFKFYPSIL